MPIILFTLLFSVSFAYNIVGNSVIEENTDWKIVVTPHTCYSPVGDCTQIVEITNKTGLPQALDITSSFPKASITQITQQKNIPPTYSTTEKSYVCKDEIVTTSNVSTCQKTTTDLNGAKTTTVLFNNSKAVFDSKTNTFSWSETTQTKPTTFETKPITATAKTVSTDYKISDTISTTTTYKIKYKANNSGKWSLKLSNGFEIDPWFQTNYTYRKPITITLQDANYIDQNTTIDVNLDTAALVSGGKMRSDCKDLEIIKGDTNTQMQRQVRECNTTTTHIRFRPDYNILATDTNFYIYYGNAADTVDENDLTKVYWLWQKDFPNLNGWSQTGAVWSAVGNKARCDTTSGTISTLSYNVGLNSSNFILTYDSTSVASGAADSVFWNGLSNVVDIEASQEGRLMYFTKATTKYYHLYNSSFIGGPASVTSSWLDGNYTLDFNNNVLETLKFGNTPETTLDYELQNIRYASKYVVFACRSTTTQLVQDINNIVLMKTVSSKPINTFGAEETYTGYTTIVADFNYNSPYFDTEAGITFSIVNFTNLSTYGTNPAVAIPNDFNWDINGTRFSDSNNPSYTFTAIGDYNISLTTDTNTGLVSQKAVTIQIRNPPQGITIVATLLSDTNSDINLQFNATTTTSGTPTYIWLLHDSNSTNATPWKDFNTSGNKNICVTLTIGSPKTACSTIVIGKANIGVPKNEQSPNALVFPYNVLLDTNSTSAYTDRNGIESLFDWRYSTETKSHTIIIDINTDYFQASYGWQIQPLDFNIQPYVLKQSVAGSVRFHTREAITGSTLSNVKITIKKIIGTMTTVGEQYTDTSGTATFYMIFNDSYYIDAEYQGRGFSNWLLKPVTGDYTITIGSSGSSGTDVNYVTVRKFVLTYTPNTSDYNIATIFNITTRSVIGLDIKSIQTLVFRDDNTLIYTYNYNEGGTLFTTHTQATANISGTRNGETLRIRTIVTDANDINHTYVRTWSWNTSANKPIEKIQAITKDFGTTGAAIVGLFLTLFIVGLAVYGGLGSRGVFVVGGMCFLVLGFLGFFPLALAIIVCVVGFFAAYMMGGY